MLNSPPHTIARRTDPQTSYDAAAKAPTGKMRQFVFDLIEQSGPDGTTIKEMVAANPDIQASSITSRPNELEKQGLVHYRGDKRDGARMPRMTEAIGYVAAGWFCLRFMVLNASIVRRYSMRQEKHNENDQRL